MIYFFARQPDGSLIDISSYVNLQDPSKISLTMNAEQGAVGTSSIPIEDPNGTLQSVGLRLFNVYDDLAPFLITYSGYTAERNVSRDTYRAGPLARIWDTSLEDVNSVPYRRVATASDANRSAETDVERVTWALTSFYPTANTTYLSTAGPVNMDAVDYRGQFLNDIIDDCSQQSGKNWYWHVVFDGADYVQAIWYGSAALTTYSSSAKISNVLSEVDSSVTWAASLDTKLTRDPSRVFSGVYMPYDGGFVYRTRPATATQFALAGRDTVAPSINVKTSAKATARADRYLLDISTEEDAITTSIIVPSAHVNDIRPGMRVECKFTHLPSYNVYTWFRVLNRTVTVVSPPDVTGALIYQVALTLSPAVAQVGGNCSTISASIQTWDSGQQGSLNPAVTGPPVDVTPDSPSAYPSAVVGGFFTHRGDDTLGTDPVVTGLTVQTGGLNPNYAGNPRVATMGYAGYDVLASGSPGTWRLNWTVGNGGTERWRAMAVYIPTAATSPVQSGVQYQTGGTITLGATPTVGNLMVLVRMVETSNFSSVPIGWTQQVAGSFHTSSPGDFYIDICTKCVQEGDTTLQTLVDTSFSHWQYIQEWALT